MAKVLIVDDDKKLLSLVGEYLESLGFESGLANDAEQARNHLRHSRYDMVISDLNMPGESGLDLLRYVSSRYPEMPFVLMTGCEDTRIRRESLRMGADAYIRKPFFLSDLLQTVTSMVQAGPQARMQAPAA